MSLYDTATAWVEKKLVQEGRCKKFIAVSELTKHIFLKEYPIDPDRVVVIHPGVHLPAHTPQSKNRVRGTIRKELGIRQDDIVIVFASMNFEIKGLDSILHTLRRLKSGFKLIVAGKGNARKYRRIAIEAGIAENVIFTGAVDRARLTDLYLAGDLYMMLSKFDTFGMVVLEAMAAGLPVIVSQSVGAKDIIEEEKNGFVISDPADSSLIASKIQFLFNEQNRKDMSAAAYRTASQNTWDIVVSKYADLYAEVLAEKKRKDS
jgi:UDP-glucose:(heptosyl)LPS alpha-1,3-glucosyltransferase